MTRTRYRLWAAALLCSIARAETPAWIEAASKDSVYLLMDKQTNELKVLSLKDNKLYGQFRAISGLNPGDKEHEGDKRTPEGIYFVTRDIPKSTLVALHGAAAYALDYPNTYDRMMKHTGSGIWVHGVITDERLKKRFDTRGCVALANGDVVELRKVFKWGQTPIVIVDHEDPAKPVGLEPETGPYTTRVKAWIDAWKSMDVEKYLAFYHPDFKSKGMDLAAWGKYKRRLTKQYKKIDVELTNLRVLVHGKYVTAIFDQEYNSDRFKSQSRKIMYFLGPPAEAKIIQETVFREK